MGQSNLVTGNQLYFDYNEFHKIELHESKLKTSISIGIVLERYWNALGTVFETVLERSLERSWNGLETFLERSWNGLWNGLGTVFGTVLERSWNGVSYMNSAHRQKPLKFQKIHSFLGTFCLGSMLKTVTARF